jgi:hypothetical protein
MKPKLLSQKVPPRRGGGVLESMVEIIIIKAMFTSASRVSLIKGAPKAALNREHDWYIGF